MLCQLSFTNYKSYKDEATLDFQAASVQEFKESLLSKGKSRDKFLPMAVIYGPNGGGKSGVIEALASLVRIVTSAANDEARGHATSLLREYRPFMFDEESKWKPTEYEVFFRAGKHEYRYALAHDGDGIVYEQLDRKALAGGTAARLFAREGGEISVGPSLTTGRAVARPSASMPLLAYMSNNFSFQSVAEAMGWFLSVEAITRSSDYSSVRLDLDALESDQKLILEVLKRLDLGIDGYDVLEQAPLFVGDAPTRVLALEHAVGKHSYLLNSSSESFGTQRLLSLMPSIVRSLKDGAVLAVDELDACLHPKMLREIVGLYRNPQVNTGGGQLIFTSHDVSTMRSSVFRRDEIWFASRGDDESSILYSLHEIRDTDGGPIKTTAAYDKQYLEGRYGSDPYFQRMTGWN